MFLCPVPAAEVFEGEDGYCSWCDALLVQAYFVAGRHYCEACATELAREEDVEAREYTREHCRVTRPLPPYDPALEYRCTPEEYAGGARESYTPNAHACYCRHNCTNYDELIRGLERYCPLDQIRYEAIRSRIEELLEEAREAALDAELEELLREDGPEEEDGGATEEV